MKLLKEAGAIKTLCPPSGLLKKTKKKQTSRCSKYKNVSLTLLSWKEVKLFWKFNFVNFQCKFLKRLKCWKSGKRGLKLSEK